MNHGSGQRNPVRSGRRAVTGTASEDGSFTAMLVVLVLPLILVAGLAFDGARALVLRANVIGATAAAAQAAAGESSTTASVQAASDVISGSGMQAVSIAGPSSSGVWCVTAKGTVDTVFLGVVGINQFTSTQESCAQ